MKSKVSSILFGLLFLIFAAQPALAAAQGSTLAAQSATGVGFYVQALIPQNQIDTSASYFDLRMEPEQIQRLQVQIVNEENQPLHVDVTAISASTNENGIIDYRTPGIRDETLAIPFSEIAEVETADIVVPPLGTALATVLVEMPQEEYDGAILGGIVVTKRNPELEEEDSTTSDANMSGAALQNVYNYVIGVKLAETDAEVLPDFDLVDVAAESVNYSPAYVHYIRNFEAAIVRGVDIEVEITRAGEDTPLATERRTGVNMAPNSVMKLAVSSGGSIQPGDYNTLVTLRLEEETWHFEHSFTVDANETQVINQTPGGSGPSGGLPVWAIVLIVLLAILLLVVIFLLILLLRRRRDEEEEEEV